MRHVAIEEGFDAWRDAARQLLSEGVPPDQVFWYSATEHALFSSSEATPAMSGGTLFSITGEPAIATAASTSAVLHPRVRVPAAFVDLAKTVICHRDQLKWPTLYRAIWRVTHGEHDLLKNAVDEVTRALAIMEKAVRRDCHKMTAFVRFKKLVTGDGREQFVAWHRPDHLIVRRMASFFVDRFRSMDWAILTPDTSVAWENGELQFGPGVPTDPLLGDVVEDLWTTYYANIFNPARIKLKAMQAEMPRKHWPTLPETRLIPQMLKDAPARVQKMLDAAPKVPVMLDYVPKTSSLRVLHEAAEKCRACDIGCHATQVVFGEGPKTARVMFVGEQPGDQEDLAGKPFVGPSGALLNEVLDQIGIDRSQVYVTNAVKHFKFEPRGKRRIHAKPNAREMAACKPWLLAELDIVKPDILVLLGATAAQTLVGRQFRITQSRGQWFKSDWSEKTIATFHPSAILRSIDAESMEKNKSLFTDDLRKVARQLAAA
ncbi:MAG: Uracil-DNA glycosylase, putative family 6 [Phycisphaerales bacterium]|nr:Uracil-DNA glycosylase, putative family 6 [Phycisphaerales bacterium]